MYFCVSGAHTTHLFLVGQGQKAEPCRAACFTSLSTCSTRPRAGRAYELDAGGLQALLPVFLTLGSPSTPNPLVLPSTLGCSTHGPGWLQMWPNTKSLIYLEPFFAHQFSCVFVYLICGPRQHFFFQCGLRRQKVGHPCDESSVILRLAMLLALQNPVFRK